MKTELRMEGSEEEELLLRETLGGDWKINLGSCMADISHGGRPLFMIKC